MKRSMIFKIILFVIISAGYIVSWFKFGEGAAWTVSLFAAIFLSLVLIVYDKGYDRLFKRDNPANVFGTIIIALMGVDLLARIIVR